MQHPGTQVEDLPLLDPEVPDEQPSGTHLLELWSDRKEAEAIPELLRPGEGVVCVGSGTVLRSGRLAQSRWLVVLTDRRLLCIKGAVAATRRVIEMPVSAIRSISRKGLFRRTLTLDTGYGNLRLGHLKNHFAHELIEGLEALMRTHNGDTHATPIPRAHLPAKEDDADLRQLVDEVNGLRQAVEELRGRVMTLELSSGQPPS